MSESNQILNPKQPFVDASGIITSPWWRFLQSLSPSPKSITIPSASAMSLPPIGTLFNVTGTTNIITITGGWGARSIILLFNAVLTVSNSAGANHIRLSGGSNFVVNTGFALQLVSTGMSWFETGRST